VKIKELSKLISLRTLKRIIEYYEIALGFHLIIRNTQGELLITSSKPSTLWNYIHTNHQTEINLQDILQKAFTKCERTGQIVIFERHPDTHAFTAPIYISGQIRAFFIGGLVRFNNPNLDIAKIQSERLGITLDNYLEAYLDLPLMNHDKFEACANLIKIIGSTFYTLEIEGNEIKINQQKIQQKYKELSNDLSKTSEELGESLHLYRSIFEKSTDGIYVADMKGNMIEINKSGAKLLGYNQPEDLIGKPIKNLYIYPEEREKFLEVIFKQGYINHWTSHLKILNGSEKFFDTNATLINDSQNRPLYIQGIFRDFENKNKTV